MNEVSTTPIADTTKIAPIVCAPWCMDGTGHADALFAQDQFCSSGQVAEVGLSRGKHERYGSLWFPGTVEAALSRDGEYGETFVSLTVPGVTSTPLTVAEAQSFAQQLLALVDLAGGEA
jgi:hypothetical protein